MLRFKSNYQRSFFTLIMVLVMGLSHVVLLDGSELVDLVDGESGVVMAAKILTAEIEQGPERELHTRDESGEIAESDLFALSDGEEGVGIDKRIVELNRETGEAIVELSLQGAIEAPVAMYVTLLLDCSNSMDKNLTGTSIKKLASMKTAAKELIEDILSDSAHPETKLSIVTFHQNAVIRTFGNKIWAGVNSSDRTAATGIVEGLNQSSLGLGTNTQGAFHEAYKIFSEAATQNQIAEIKATGQDVNQYVLLISDGKPTVCYPPLEGGPYYLASNTSYTEAVKDNHNKNAAYLPYFTNGPYIYGKGNINTSIRRNANDSLNNTNNYDNVIFSGNGNTANGANLVASAVYEAGRVKKDLGVKVYALGIDLGGEAEDTALDGSALGLDEEKQLRAQATMEGVRSSDTRVYYADSPDELNRVRGEIFSEMQEFSVRASIQDVIGDNFEFSGLLDQYNSGNMKGTIWYDNDTRTVHWDGAISDKLQTIRYKVTVKGNAAEGVLDTNESAYVEYVDPSSSENVSMAFPKPHINNAVLSVCKELYKADGLTRSTENGTEFNITVRGVDLSKVKSDTGLYKNGATQYYRFLSLDSNAKHQFTLEESSLSAGYQFVDAQVGNETFSMPLTEPVTIGANGYISAVYRNIEVEVPAAVALDKTIRDMNGNWVKKAWVQSDEEFAARFVIKNIGSERLRNIRLQNNYGIADDGVFDDGNSIENSFSIVFPENYNSEPGPDEELIVMVADDGSTEYAILQYTYGDRTIVDNVSIVFPADFNGMLEPGEELVVMITINGLTNGAAYSDTVTVTAEIDGGGDQVTDRDTAVAETVPSPDASPSPDATPAPDPFLELLYPYTVEYYKDAMTSDNLLGSTSGISEFEAGHGLTAIDVSDDLGGGWLDAFMPEGYDHGVMQGGLPIITEVVENNVVKVLYTNTSSDTLVYPYTVEYYKDYVAPDTQIGDPVHGGAYYPEGYRLTEEDLTKNIGDNWLNARQPENYNTGAVQDALPIITIEVEDNVVRILYLSLPAAPTYPYTVEYYKDSVTADNKLGSVSGLSEFELGYGLTALDVYDDLGGDWLDAFLPDGYEHGIVLDGWPIITVTVENNVVKVLYTNVPSGTSAYPYTVEYYKDYIAPDTLIGDPVHGGAYYPEGYRLTEEDLTNNIGENWLDARQPENYSSGAVQDALPVITTEAKDNVVRILYISLPTSEEGDGENESGDTASNSVNTDGIHPSDVYVNDMSPSIVRTGDAAANRTNTDGTIVIGSEGSAYLDGNLLSATQQLISSSSSQADKMVYDSTSDSYYESEAIKVNPKTEGCNINHVIFLLISCFVLAALAFVWKDQIGRKVNALK